MIRKVSTLVHRRKMRFRWDTGNFVAFRNPILPVAHRVHLPNIQSVFQSFGVIASHELCSQPVYDPSLHLVHYPISGPSSSTVLAYEGGPRPPFRAVVTDRSRPLFLGRLLPLLRPVTTEIHNERNRKKGGGATKGRDKTGMRTNKNKEENNIDTTREREKGMKEDRSNKKRESEREKSRGKRGTEGIQSVSICVRCWHIVKHKIRFVLTAYTETVSHDLVRLWCSASCATATL